MKLSIIIPVYQTEATLDRCVESVVSQSAADMEIILVDDGSPDGAPQRCDLWAQRDRRISVVHQSNGGLSAARNAGIRRATGDFLLFLDSDDCLAPATLDAMAAKLDDADIVEFPICRHYGTPGEQRLQLPERQFDTPQTYWLETQAYLHTYACNKLFRRWLFDHVAFPEKRVFEDAYTLPRLLQLHPRVRTTHAGLYCYNDNPDGITAKAGGRELTMLLDAHLTGGMPVNDDYYLHLLNIQIDVCRLTGSQPVLPFRRVTLSGLKGRQRLKAFTQNLLKVKGICQLAKILHRLSHW